MHFYISVYNWILPFKFQFAAFSEERARADAERVEKDKELGIRISLEDEISNLKSDISLLGQKGGFEAREGNEEGTLLRKHISDGEREIKRLEQLLEKEKIKSDLERKNAEAEKRKAADARKALEEEKSKADEKKWLVEIERKKAEEYRLQLESEQQNRRLEAQKHKLARDKRCADLEKAKVEELRKLAEENSKKIMEEKNYANNVSRQLKESFQTIDELQNRVNELVSSKKEANTVQPDKRIIDEIAKLKDRLESDFMKRESDEAKLASEFLKYQEVTKRLETEKRKASKEKKRADDLSKQLEEDRRTIEELRKERLEFVSSRNLVEAPAVLPSKSKKYDWDIGKMKLLKKQLKLEKMRVRHAKEVAELEKGRNYVLKQELGSLKLEFSQFSNRLDFLDKHFSCDIEGTDELTKVGFLIQIVYIYILGLSFENIYYNFLTILISFILQNSIQVSGVCYCTLLLVDLSQTQGC